MDILTFIAELFKAAAWPIAVVVIALLFRTQFRELLVRLKKGKVGPAEFEFEQSVKALTEEAPELIAPTPGFGTPSVQLVASNPRAAILEAWLGVEDAVQKLARSRDISPSSSARNPLALVRALERSQALDSQQSVLFNDLRALRNQAAHDSEFSPSTDSVLSYAQLAKSLRESIEGAVQG
jgi:hypothetical protein